MRIRDPGWKKFGSVINIPDPKDCCNILVFAAELSSYSTIVNNIKRTINTSPGRQENSLYSSGSSIFDPPLAEPPLLQYVRYRAMLRILIRIILGSRIWIRIRVKSRIRINVKNRIRIRIKVKRCFRIRIKVKIQELWRFKMDPLQGCRRRRGGSKWGPGGPADQ
jgi:hypothetical protein